MKFAAVPLAPILVGMGALALLLYRALTGPTDMTFTVLIGLTGAGLVMVLGWLWDARLFGRALARVAMSGNFDEVIGGYLVRAEFRNVTRARPRRGEVVLAAGPWGIEVTEARSVRPILSVSWADVIDVAPGIETFLSQQRPALHVATLEGRLGVVLRTDPRRGILSAGAPDTNQLIERIRRLRPGSRVD